MKNIFRKYFGLTVGLTVLCTAGLLAGTVYNVFGQFVPQKPYVNQVEEGDSKGEPLPDGLTASLNTVTPEGGNQKGTLGSGKEPCSEEVPVAELNARKGTKENPFVVLEIVPEHAQQQMIYLNTDNPDYPLDLVQIGMDACDRKGTNENFVDNQNLGGYFDLPTAVGQWFCNYQYKVYKVGSDEEQETVNLVEVDKKLFRVEFTNEDIEEAGYDFSAFQKDYKDHQYSGRISTVQFFMEKYPKLFEDTGIKKKVLQNYKNWSYSYEKKVIEEGVSNSYKNKGCLVAVEPGQGDFGFASESDCKEWILTKTGTDADRWKYYETESEVPAEYLEKYGQDWKQGGGIWSGGFYYYSSDGTKITSTTWGGTKTLYEASKDPDLTGTMLKLEENGDLTIQLFESPEVAEHTYTFDYAGLKGNDVLKRSLFTFQDQEECDNFVMETIAMTPAELNAIAEKDTPETLDMIERADMFYVGAYTKSTDNIANVYETYYRYIKQDKDYTYPKAGTEEYDKFEVADFSGNDLEWSLVYKIMDRLCTNVNLPLMMTQNLGKMVNDGVNPDSAETDTHMFVTEDTISKHLDSNGSLNNMAKLYLCTVQFDMQARHKDGYIRTFYEDILPRLQTIGLNPAAMKGTGKNKAETTGYYERTLVQEDSCGGVSLDSAVKKSCFYLWNMWTFYPAEIKLSSGNQMAAPVEEYLKYGYLESFFNSNADVFHDGVADHHSGSDGYDDKNVGIVHGGSNSDTNHSTLLGATESSDIVNDFLNVAYQIMNKQTAAVEPLVVTVDKQKRFYEKLTDDSVMIDYNSSAKQKNDKTLYLKVTISNMNNEPGIIKSIQMIKENEQSLSGEQTPQTTLDKETALSKKTVLDINGSNGIKGYEVPAQGSVTFYVPYQLSDWQKGYQSIRFTLQGRKYRKKKDKYNSVLGAEVTQDVTITERTLFNLE